YETFENYAPPDYELFQDPPDLESTIDNQILWFLLWIMTFRTRFNIIEIAIEALIKFMKLVLTEISGDGFRDFPDSMYLTRKKLGLKDHFHNFVS
ncbi:9691_t:CDS:1, partial [Funneliformis geosporum]